jgi:catechol 2,3-dioxygenase-like lactoylglutathione lyase family enzyme
LSFLALISVAACAVASAAGGGTVDEKAGSVIDVRFVYNYCNDLAAMKHFYTDLLGLNEVGYNEDYRYLCYQCEGFRLMFFRPDAEVELLQGWADQPGYQGGTTFDTSWGIQVPEAEFTGIVERLKAEGVEARYPDPEWCVDSYWGFYVKDPMGRTVEVFAMPKERPASTTWPGE